MSTPVKCSLQRAFESDSQVDFLDVTYMKILDTIGAVGRGLPLVCVFSKEGLAGGTIKGPFSDNLLSIVEGLDGSLYVSDGGHRQVYVKKQKVNDWMKFAPGTFGMPAGLGITVKGDIVVTDPIKKCIFTISPEGEVVSTLNLAPHELQYPCYSTVLASGDTIVSDSWRDLVFIIDAQGNLKKTLNTPQGNSLGGRHFYFPSGVGVDDNGNIMVAEASGKVQVFSAAGEYIGMMLPSDDTINTPRGISFVSTGQLLVAEQKSNKVKILDYQL